MNGLFSFLPCSSDPGWGSASWILEVLLWRERSALWPYAFECQRPVKWRSSSVSLMSAFPATMNRGTRKSATRCVHRLCSASVWTWHLLLVCESFRLSQVYKVLVSVGQQEWFVFRRYAEFDKLYNTVSNEAMLLSSLWLTPFLIYVIVVTFSPPSLTFINSYGNNSRLWT